MSATHTYLQLLASTQKILPEQNHAKDHHPGEARFFKSAQWSPDGTCIISNASDNHIRTFIVPHDLLEHRTGIRSLDAYSTVKSAEPVDALSIYPFFDLQEPSTNLMLSAANEQPIRLTSTATAQLLASYPLVNPTTEAYIKPNSLLFTQDGSHFLAGSDSSYSIFDLSRPGQEAVSWVSTGPKKVNTFTNPSTTMRGRISAMSIDQQHNVLAVGTFGRHVGLYDSAGRGACLGVFCVQGTEADNVIKGNGVTQLFWSSCGRYLYIAERKSDGIMFYDIRMTGQLLGWLEGRDAYTNQRMCVDVNQTHSDGSTRIWAGGMDGNVRMWKDPSQSEGGVAPSTVMPLHSDAVNSVGTHRDGGVMVTTSGQRHFDEIEGESSLRLWAVKSA